MKRREFPGLLDRIRMAFIEDFGSGDITSAALIPSGMRAKAALVAKGRGVAAGVRLPWVVFLTALDPD
ncbi:MAG: nicotinate-nucleotide diphosphorylase (carboxylating), partial [Planctomycetota bacterium]|nr:nicotinate-nucleotide diphosphorylase (carboxylating) [Planctomycetota bacterium]